LKITIRANGPILIAAEEMELVDHEGRPFGLAGRKQIGLCRCGHSGNKPFCDGSHNRQGFQSVCDARELPPPAPKA